MRLELIVIQGFKSFAEKTEIKVFPGVTCIVGPNGCGKSNVADAIRWALGEQSPKTLRGQKMEDVIFHGASSRKAVGLAEVGLVFNNDGGLNVPWSEVGVARRLYRTGESEYILNKGVCRLRDIQDLFAGTGVNPKAYALMDQDRLNHVLTAKPWERRIFIEEAAGIARYKQQRAETQGKLEATRQNLQRVRDVMEEVRRQLGSIERQARKAQQYKALHAERQALDLALLAADCASLTALAGTLAREMNELRDAEEQRRARGASLTGRLALQSAGIQDTEYRLGDMRQSVQKIQGEAERLLERREQMGLQIRDLTDEDARLTEEIRTLGDRRAALGTEREGKLAALTESRGRHGAQEARMREIEGELEACRAMLAERRQRFEQLREERITVAGARADLTRSSGELRERGVHLDRRCERLESEAAATRSEAEQLAGARARLEAARRQTGAQLSLLTVELQQMETARTEREVRRAEAQEALAELRLALAARQSALEALERLEGEREGYGAGVRAIFSKAAAAELRGVVGTVADLLEVPPGLERAVEAVLGDRLQWVVVERFEHARAAVAYLRDHGLGSATFLPLEHLPVADGPGPDDNGVRWVTRSVGANAPHLVHHLLAQVAIVDHLDEAEALWRRNGVVATYVTPGGEVLGPTGRLHGGGNRASAATEHSLLARKRQLRDLEGEVQRLSAVVDAGQTEVTTLGASVVTLRAQRAGLGRSVQARLAERLAGEKDLERAAQEHERVLRHLETISAESQQVAREAEETDATLARLTQRIAIARNAEEAIEAAAAKVREAIESAQADETAIGAELTACRVDLASATERVEALGRELPRLDEIGRDLAQRLAQAGQRQTQLTERRAWLADERERTDLAAREVAVERDRTDAAARQATEEHDGLTSELRAVEHDSRGAESELGRLVASAHEIDIHSTECRVRREELGQEAWRVYGVDAPALVARHDPARDLDGVRDRVADLEQRLAAIGPVNLVADDEYRELDERLTFLRTQHDDLTASIKDLEKALRGMTRTAQDRC